MKKHVMILLSCFCFLLMTGCGVESEQKVSFGDGVKRYYLYEINPQENDLLLTEFQPKDESTEGMLQELEQRMTQASENGDKLNILPANVSLLNHMLSGNVLTLNFTRNYKDMGVIREMLVRYSIVKNFLQIPDISAVQIQVEGAPLTDSKGQEVGMMNANSYTESFSTNVTSYRFANLTLYFATREGAQLIPEERNVYYMSSLPLERVVLEQLMRGPAFADHFATVSPETRILSIVNSDGVCYINFDENFATDVLAVHPEVTIYSIVNSITSACDVEKVQISVGGESDRMFRDMMELDEFYGMNTRIVKEDPLEHTAEEETAGESETTKEKQIQ